MTRADMVRHRRWYVGDRLWTTAHGGGTLLERRTRAGRDEGRVAFDAQPDAVRWIVLNDSLDRVPRRLPLRALKGLPDAVVGQPIWHVERGRGVITGTRVHPEHDPVVQFATIAFDNADGGTDGGTTGHEIDFDSAALRDSEPSPLGAEITACSAGWIDLEIKAGARAVALSLSAVFDPLAKLLAWLEALALGVQECGVDLDEEGCERTLRARQNDLHRRASTIAALDLVVREGGLDQSGALLLSARVERQVLVSALYRCLRDFAASPRYDPMQWEEPVAQTDDETGVITGQCGMPLRLWRSEIIERWLEESATR